MELTSGVIIFAVVAAVVIFVLVRLGFRHEAAAPVDAPHTPARRSTMEAREERESHPLVNWLLDRAFEQTGIKVAGDALARKRIVEAAANATEELRNGGSATISLPFLTADARGPKHFNVRFKRTQDSTFELLR